MSCPLIGHSLCPSCPSHTRPGSARGCVAEIRVSIRLVVLTVELVERQRGHVPEGRKEGMELVEKIHAG